MKKPGKTISMDFDLRQLEIFTKVVELGSFSKAGDSVFLAQSSVSERVAALEEMMGAKLLDRMGKRAVPTKTGQRLYRHAISLLNLKKTVCLDMQDFLGLKGGEVHIGCSTIPGEYILPGIIGRFCREYPQVKVAQSIAPSAEIESRVLDGDLEFGVVGARTLNSRLSNHELWEDELLLSVPSDHRWASREKVRLEELTPEPYVSREAGSGTLRIIEEHLVSRGLKGMGALNVVAKFGTSTAVKEAVKAGLGVSILSLKAVETEIRAGILRGLRVKGLPISRRFCLIRDKRRTMSPLCGRFINFLVSTAGREDRSLRV